MLKLIKAEIKIYENKLKKPHKIIHLNYTEKYWKRYWKNVEKYSPIMFQTASHQI